VIIPLEYLQLPHINPFIHLHDSFDLKQIDILKSGEELMKLFSLYLFLHHEYEVRYFIVIMLEFGCDEIILIMFELVHKTLDHILSKIIGTDWIY